MIKHVFVTHAVLQERIVDAIIRDKGLLPAEVIVLKVRGSWRQKAPGPYLTLNGEKYMSSSGWNFFKHRARNGEIYAHFKRDVLDRLSPDYEVYSPMYTYWYLRLLKERAKHYSFLEDGFGSYKSLAEYDRLFQKARKSSFSKKMSNIRQWLSTLGEQRIRQSLERELLFGANELFISLPGAFSWADQQRVTLLKNVFPPKYVGEYEGCVILGTSTLVEQLKVPLEDYLRMLGQVLNKVIGRGITVLYVKLHPVQSAHRNNAKAYRAFFESFSEQLEIRELPANTEIEGLAAGNNITFITGISTLGFHVAATGATVYSYLDLMVEMFPIVQEGMPEEGDREFRRVIQAF